VYEPQSGAVVVAALAEANVPLFVAAFVSLWTSLAIASVPSLGRVSGRRSRFGSVALILSGIAFVVIPSTLIR